VGSSLAGVPPFLTPLRPHSSDFMSREKERFHKEEGKEEKKGKEADDTLTFSFPIPAKKHLLRITSARKRKKKGKGSEEKGEKGGEGKGKRWTATKLTSQLPY